MCKIGTMKVSSGRTGGDNDVQELEESICTGSGGIAGMYIADGYDAGGRGQDGNCSGNRGKFFSG